MVLDPHLTSTRAQKIRQAKMVTPKAPAAASSDSDGSDPFPKWFKPGSPKRTKWLAFWLLVWNCTALLDALAFTLIPEQNLDGYLGEGTWCPATLAMVRMMANCQLGLVSTFALVALTADERTLKIMFRMLIFITLGAFRGVYLGVMEGTIRPPWETQWASLLSLPPMLFLCYFAFVF